MVNEELRKGGESLNGQYDKNETRYYRYSEADAFLKGVEGQGKPEFVRLLQIIRFVVELQPVGISQEVVQEGVDICESGGEDLILMQENLEALKVWKQKQGDK